MAGIDHTVILFKNGKYVKNVYEIDCDKDIHRVLVNVPFSYSRDGEITGFDFDRHKDVSKRWNGVCETSIIEQFESDDVFVWVLHKPTYNVSLYMDGSDVYVLLGGYGHYDNPYTHFMDRGFGEEFELEILAECYSWLCENVLPDKILGASRYDDEKSYNKALYYTSYWDLPNEQRTNYKNRKIEHYVSKPDEIGDWESIYVTASCSEWNQ